MPEFTNHLNVICLESKAFYALIEEVVDRIEKKENIVEEKWISDIEAMQLLRISSKTTLQKLRDEGAIRFTQPSKKLILYDRKSLLEYLEKHVKETF
jgi:hypothetical protein